MGDIKYENDSGSRLRLAGVLPWPPPSCGLLGLTIRSRERRILHLDSWGDISLSGYIRCQRPSIYEYSNIALALVSFEKEKKYQNIFFLSQ